MSSLGFHTAWPAAALAAIAIPLIAFYFLKLKRERAEVPSLVLWRQVMEDRRVNSPFQRFKRNLLLWLQLLILALLVLAAMQPFMHGRGGRGSLVPILIDHSASMSARATANGPTRLDEAKKTIRARIDNLAPGDQLCLIAFARDARRLTGFTDDRRELRSALDDLTVDDTPSDPTSALRLAQALGRTKPFERAELVTDGNLPERVDTELAFALDFRRVGMPAPNIGITACDAMRRTDARWDVFVSVESAAEAPSGATLELLSGGRVLDRKPLLPTPGGVERIGFTLPGDEALELEARLISDGFDALAADDRAFLALPVIRPMRVHVPERLRAWRHAAQSLASAQVFPGEGGIDATGAAFDLVIGDQDEDEAIPATVRLMIGRVPKPCAPLVSIADEGGSTVVDYRRAEPALSHVMLDDLLITERVRYEQGVGEKDFEALGFEVLVHSERGPLMIKRGSPGSAAYHLLFHTDRSTLPYRVALPVLVANLLSEAMQAAGQREVRCLATGILPPVAFAPGATATVTMPDGQRSEAVADREGLVSGVRSLHAGIYHLASGAARVDLGAGLLDAEETRLGSVDRLQVREVAVHASGEALPSERVLWPSCALAALVVCLGEWWYFNRRPQAWSARPSP